MAQSNNQFILPDLYAGLPLDNGHNPFFDVVGKESRDWINSYDILPRDRRERFTSTSGELLASYTHPYAARDEFRVCTDFINVLFMLDEVSDIQDSAGARETIHHLVRILRGDPDCDDGSPLVKMLISFVGRLMKVTTPSCQRRFCQEIITYMEAVEKEAEYRTSGKFVDVENFDSLRRGNGGVFACFVLLEPALGINLPDEVIEHPAYGEISTIGNDLICWSNDLISFDRERAEKIDTANLLSVLIEHKGYGLQQAVDHVGKVFADRIQRIHQLKEEFPSFGPEVDSMVAKYIEGVEIWISGHLDFSFVSGRYFGKDGLEVKRTRIVKLSPQKSA